MVIRILHVDDDYDFLYLTKHFLASRNLDFEIIPVSNPCEVLRLLKGEDFDLIISDYYMPEMDGLALLKELRAFNDSIPFILFTGEKINEIAIEALNLGVEYVLLKDVKSETIYLELAHLIRKVVFHKQNNENCQEWKTNFCKLVEIAGDGVVFHKDGIIKNISDSAAKLFGYSSSEVIGTSLFDYISLKYHNLVQKAIFMNIEDFYEIDVIKKNGLEISVGIIGRKCNYRGHLVRMAVVRDLTKQKQLEISLREYHTQTRHSN